MLLLLTTTKINKKVFYVIEIKLKKNIVLATNK